MRSVEFTRRFPLEVQEAALRDACGRISEQAARSPARRTPGTLANLALLRRRWELGVELHLPGDDVRHAAGRPSGPGWHQGYVAGPRIAARLSQPNQRLTSLMNTNYHGPHVRDDV